jgi:hypothetical protein
MSDKSLSVESAIAALSGEDISDEAQADASLPEDEQDEEIDAEAESQADAGEDGDDPEADPDAGDDEEEVEPETAIETPQFLDEKERAAFAALPRAAQEMLLKHDKALVADYTRKTQAVSEERKAVQAQRQQLDRIVETFGTVIPEAEKELADWQRVDWVALAQKVDAETYNQYRAQAEASQKKVFTLRQQEAQAREATFSTHVDEQTKLLKELAADPVKGAPEFLKPDAPEKVWKPLFEYVKGLGYGEDEIRWIGAADAIVAYKAMRYDQMVKAGKTPALTPKPDAKSNAKPVRAGAAASSSKRAVSKDVAQQFRKTGSTSLAISMLQDLD